MPSRPLPSLASPRHSCSSSTPGGARCACKTRRQRLVTGELYRGVMHSIRLSKCGTAAHQRRPSTGSPRRVCAAERQFAHLGPRCGPRRGPEGRGPVPRQHAACGIYWTYTGCNTQRSYYRTRLYVLTRRRVLCITSTHAHAHAVPWIMFDGSTPHHAQLAVGSLAS